jgi:hypothetical protein
MRAFLTVATVVAAVGALAFGILQSVATSPLSAETVKDLPANVLIIKAIELRLSHSLAMFDAALVSVGALWALMLQAKAKNILKSWDEWIMLLSSTAVLLCAVWMYWDYTINVHNALITGGKTSGYSPDISVPDVFHAAFDIQYTALAIFVTAGVLCSALTLFRVHRLP